MKMSQPQKNTELIFSSSNEMNYNINNGYTKSMRYYFIKDLTYRYMYRQLYHLDQHPHQPVSGSGLNTNTKIIFLHSDQYELIDQLKLIVLEKVEGSDNPMPILFVQ